MSLKRLVLRDFVIVHELDLHISDRFTVLTGETGAGKSILIDALQLATGGRADAGCIREGANRADISAEFDQPAALTHWLEEAGFETGSTLLLRRTVDLQGKSRAWVNGSPATATQLRHLGEHLLDIHGQHAWQSLTSPAGMCSLLDAYAQLSVTHLAACWQQWQLAKQRLNQSRLAQDALLSERERLNWQIGELDKLNPQSNEWPALNAEHTRLVNAQALLDAAQGAVMELHESDRNALTSLRHATHLLQQQAHIEPVFKSLCEVLESGLVQIEDALRELRAYLRKTEIEPERLRQVDDRMGLWVSLARRYKRHPDEMAELLQSWRHRLSELESANDLNALEQAQACALAAYMGEAQRLSQKRAEAAPQLAASVSAAMQDLGMEGGSFNVLLEACDEPTKTGLEGVSFLVAGHGGSTPRPIQKVASGGELSRIALAIAVTTSKTGSAQTLIFDEVDAGIGGTVAATVGRLMQQLGRDRQVLAVTHLPQVAACANHHLIVAKERQGSQTISSVSPVDGEARVSELARMLGGQRVMRSTLNHARDMLQGESSYHA